MDKLQYFYPEGHENHFEYGHPERPERVFAIRQALEANKLWKQYKKVGAKLISKEEISQTHDLTLINRVIEYSNIGARLDADTYLTNKSYDLAIQSAGGAISIAEAVWKRDTHYGFALCRPPGHHATKQNSMGFCLFNNVAIAVNHLINEYAVKKIAIIDLDVHHGNGTQDIFYARDDVYFFSIHQSPFYPFTGYQNEIGENSGEGFTTNIPFPPGVGDIARINAINNIIIPQLTKYEPEILFISVGFDAHWRDPLAQHNVSCKGYGQQINLLADWANNHCDGKMALFLEGGYDIEAGAQSSVSIIKHLLKMDFEDYIGPSQSDEDKAWQTIIKNIQLQWKI